MWAQEGTPFGITATLIAAFSGLMGLMGWLLKHLLTTTIPEQTKAGQAGIQASLEEFGKLREQFDVRQTKLLEHCQAEADKEREGSERRYQAAILELKEMQQSLLNQGGILSQLLSITRQRTRLSDVVVSAEEAIWSKTLDGIITSWNYAAERLLGWKGTEVIGQSMFKIMPADAEDREREAMDKLRHGQRVERYETERLHRDGQRVALFITLSPIRDPSGRVVGVSSIAREQ